ncbi:MAG: hypothetical protein KA004_01535 [Verrucomicrobiales bacterium]|nr:hypothetical protein [Verrucomicrobiales bacterium]
MKLRHLFTLLSAALLLLPPAASGQTTAFTYQGRLTDGNAAAFGNYDVRFRLFPVSTGGSALSTQTVNPLVVTNGLFTATLDFGSNFSGDDRFLQIEVRPAGDPSPYTILTPRQKITSAPYASRAASSATAAALSGSIAAGQISGGTLASTLFADNSIAATRLVNDSVGANQIGPGAIASVELATGAVTAAKIDPAIGLWSKNGSNIGYLGGNVGIGTGTPSGALLDVEGALRLNDNDVYLRASANILHGLGWYGAGKPWGSVSVNGPVLYGDDGGALGTAPDDIALNWDDLGTVRIGSAARGGSLEMTTSGVRSIRIANDGFLPGIQAVSSTVGDGYAGFMRVRHVVEIWPKSDGSAGAKLDVRNSTGAPTITLHGQSGEATVKTLNITGGSDLAEPFPMDADAPEGSVMIIDEEHPGRLKVSERAYDSRVAGIVSGANGVQPGISLRQTGVLEEGRNVALSGRVYALADATGSPIKPGDLLTTSDRPGHVMKATDHPRAQGAVIGKAMSRLAGGTGTVLVLVNLQ